MKCGTLIGSVDGLYQVVSDTTITAASNIMTNPGFETGNVSPWQRTNGFATNLTVSATRHSGNHGGNCTFGESSPQYVYQDLIAYKSAMQGRTCTFKIWMKLSYRTTPAVRIYVRANNAFYLPSALINGDDAWHQYTLSFVGNFDVGGTTTYIQVGVLSSVDNVYPVYIDDAELIISPGVTQIQASGLSGDIDNHYKVIGYLVGNGTVDYKLRLNNDSSANYGHQELKITQAPAYTAQRIENDNGVLLGNAATGQACFFEADIYAHTDQERTISVRSMSGVDRKSVV